MYRMLSYRNNSNKQFIQGFKYEDLENLYKDYDFGYILRKT